MSHNFGTPPGNTGPGVPGYGAPQNQPYGGHQPYGQQQYGGQQPYGQQYGQQPAAPSYDYTPPGYGAPQGPSPKVRPGIGWIVGAWLVAVLAVVVGVGGSVGGLFGAITDAAPAASHAPGESMTVRFDPADEADKPAVYVSAVAGTKFECGFPEGSPVGRLERPNAQITVAGADGVTWELALRFGAAQAGEYKVVCTVDGGGDARFGVGKELSAGAVAGSVVLLVVVPLVGFLLAVVVTIVVLVKRSRARKRLAAAAGGAWGAPYGG